MACGGLSLSYNRPLVDFSISFLMCTYSVSRRFAGVRESLDLSSETRSSRVDASRSFCSRRHSSETSSDPPFERTASHCVKPSMGAGECFYQPERFKGIPSKARDCPSPSTVSGIGRDQVECLAKDTRNKRFVLRWCPNEEFIA
jgi:hypothetical protein